jgi:hypothetical protein
MPVSAGTVQFSYVGDGTTTVFAFPSRFLSNSDIVVGVNGALVASGYVVTGQGEETGGNVTFAAAPPNGQTVTLIRAPAINQLLDFVNNQTILAENLDNGLDKLTIIAQYLGYLAERTLRLSQFDTTLGGNYDLMNKRITNSGAPVDANDLARLADLQAVVSASGNVPSPTVGQIGYRLQALAAGIFGWVAAGNPSAPDGTLALPGYGFANETNTGFLRPSAGLLQTSVLGGLRTELSSTALRLLVSLLSTNGTVTGGTNAQGQGAITADQTTVTSTPNNPSGVTLPTAVAGRRVSVVNRGTNPINLYPATGAQIGALAANAPLALAVGQSVDLFARSATQWEGQISQPLSAVLTQLAAPTYVRGDIIRRGVSALEALALGPAGHQLVSNGTDLVYAAGSRVLLATRTASASATLDFTEFNNALYRRYMFEIEFLLPATDNSDLWLRTSTNGGSSYDAGASDYSHFVHGGTAGGLGIGPGGSENDVKLVLCQTVGNAANEFGVNAEVDLIGAGNAAVFTVAKGQASWINSAGATTFNDFNGQRKSAADVDAVRFLWSTGNHTSGAIRMYGVA